jgi:hypothetical protein
MANGKDRAGNRIAVFCDEITSDLSTARAIMDAAKVLTALERARAKAIDGTLATGEGYANGHLLCDSTLPTLLFHGTQLIDGIEKKFEQVARFGLSQREPLRAVANG